MPTLDIASGGHTYDQSPTLHIRVNAQLPGNGRIDVRRNGAVVGSAIQTGALTYEFTDNAPVGAATYAAELVLVDQAALGGAEYVVNVDSFPNPTLVNISTAGSGVVASGGTTGDTTLNVNLSTNAALLPGVFVDVYRDGNYLGQATQLTPTTFRYTDTGVAQGAHTYVGKLRYANLNPQTLPYTVTVQTVVVPLLTVSLIETVPDASYYLNAECDGNAVGLYDAFVISIAIDAQEASGTFEIWDSTDTPVVFDEPGWTPIVHTQGATTVRRIDTGAQSWTLPSPAPASSLFGSTIKLVRAASSTVVATATVPVTCNLTPPPPQPV